MLLDGRHEMSICLHRLAETRPRRVAKNRAQTKPWPIITPARLKEYRRDVSCKSFGGKLVVSRKSRCDERHGQINASLVGWPSLERHANGQNTRQRLKTAANQQRG